MPAAVELPASSDASRAAPPAGAVQLQTGGEGGKKKNKSKSIEARGPTAMPKSRGTGFEEYYAEPPLTPAEHQDEMHLYHPRIETCIQRYRARRRLDNERSLLFNRYLTTGGVDCQPRQFTGTAGLEGTEDAEGLTKEDLRAMAANDVVARSGSKYSKYYAADNADLWTVDFTGVVSGFLSVSLPALANTSDKRLRVGVDVVDNFLRYLQIHDVCPEYADDVKAARVVCVKAHEELHNCRDALLALPGEFNLACVKLFYKDPAHKVFDDGLDPLDKIPEGYGAELIFRTTVELQEDLVGEKALEMAKDLASICIVTTREVDLEITNLIVPSNALAARYAAVSMSIQSSESGAVAVIEPAGVVVGRHTHIEEGYANQPHPSAAELAARGHEAFFLDRALMRLLVPGTKLRVVLHELSCDLNFISATKLVLPSFYTFLPQELMMDWKEPRANEREAPSVDNPLADDEVVQALADEEKE